MKTWWTNNSWRFWGWQWAFGNEDSAFTGWQEYRYMLNPDDERSLVEMICDDYANDVDRIMANPVIRLTLWLQRLTVIASTFAKKRATFLRRL